MYDVWEERVCVYILHMILFLAVLTAYISMSARGNPSLSTKLPCIPTPPCYNSILNVRVCVASVISRYVYTVSNVVLCVSISVSMVTFLSISSSSDSCFQSSGPDSITYTPSRAEQRASHVYTHARICGTIMSRNTNVIGGVV